MTPYNWAKVLAREERGGPLTYAVMQLPWRLVTDVLDLPHIPETI